MKLLYHPTHNRVLYELRQLYSELEKDHGLDNRRHSVGRRWTDRRDYCRQDNPREVNRFMWKYLLWVFMIIGFIIVVVKW